MKLTNKEIKTIGLSSFRRSQRKNVSINTFVEDISSGLDNY